MTQTIMRAEVEAPEEAIHTQGAGLILPPPSALIRVRSEKWVKVGLEGSPRDVHLSSSPLGSLRLHQYLSPPLQVRDPTTS